MIIEDGNETFATLYINFISNLHDLSKMIVPQDQILVLENPHKAYLTHRQQLAFHTWKSSRDDSLCVNVFACAVA